MTAVGSKGRTQGSALLDAAGALAGAWWVQASNSLFPFYYPFESKLRKRGTMAGYRSTGVALTGAAQAEPAQASQICTGKGKALALSDSSSQL